MKQKEKELKTAKRRYKKVKEEKEQAEKRAQEAEEETKKEKEEHRKTAATLKKTVSQNLFLKAITSRDFDQVIGFMHQIGIYAHTIDNVLVHLLKYFKSNATIEKDVALKFINRISFENKKILSFTKFATKSDYKEQVEFSEEDLISFIDNYIESIRQEFDDVGVKIATVNELNDVFNLRFKPIEIIMIIDNLISNSKKALAKNITIYFNSINKESQIFR